MDVGQFIESVKHDAMNIVNEATQYDATKSVYGRLFPTASTNGLGYATGVSNVFSTEFREVKSGAPLENAEDVQGYKTVGVSRVWGIKKSYDYTLINRMRDIKPVTEGLASFASGVELKKDQLCADIFNYGGFTTPTAASKQAFGVDGVSPEVPVPGNYTTDGLIYDGKPLFSLTGTAHPAKNGSTYINSIAQSLSIANLKTAWTAFSATNAKNEQGNPVDIIPPGGKAFLVVPPALKFTAMELVNQTSLAIAAAGTNDSREFANLVEVVEWRKLTSATAWFLMSASQYGAQWLEEFPLRTSVVDNPADRKVIVAAEFAGGPWIRNWRFFHGNNVATS